MYDISKRITTIAFILILIGGAYVVGYVRGTENFSIQAASANLINRESTENGLGEIDFAPFWKTWAVLNEKFVPSSTSSEALVTDDKKIWGAIEGLTNSFGDPYTTFLPPQESKAFEENISGNFEGVGIEVSMRDGVITVISPLKGMPAEAAGIKAGDKIVGIDGESTGQMNIDDAIAKIRGPKETSVSFTIIRDGEGEPLEISVMRDTIDIPTINTRLVGENENIFVIELYNFSGASANLFKDALREFAESEQTKLIIDLRGNPGGFLEAATDIASWFLPQGKAVVIEDFAGNGENKAYRSKGYGVFESGYDIAVLVNGGSASASEILAGALRDHGKAILVGEQTFGKGSVQELIHITPETSLKVTVARWLTPNGISISAEGLTPDYEVPLTQEDFDAGRDPQLDKAIEVLSEM